MLWGSRLSSYKIDYIQEGVKPCIIVTSLRLLPTPTTRSFLNFWITRKDERKKERARDIMTPTALNWRALNCAPLDILLHQRLVAVTSIGNSYSKIDRPIWPIYGPVAGYLLRNLNQWNYSFQRSEIIKKSNSRNEHSEFSKNTNGHAFVNIWSWVLVFEQ